MKSTTTNLWKQAFNRKTKSDEKQKCLAARKSIANSSKIYRRIVSERRS